MWLFAVLFLVAIAERSHALVVQSTRFSGQRRDQQSGIALQAIADPAFTNTRDGTDVRYAVNITVNGQDFRVAIDTGSSDLWIVTPSDFSFTETGITVFTDYGSGSGGTQVNGTIGFASVQVGGYTSNQQAFTNATSVGLEDILDIGLDGLMGLSFDFQELSALTNALVETGHEASLGQSFLFNIFDQTPGQDNFIGISLSRTADLEGTADASLAINEYDDKYAAVADAPILPLFPGGNQRFSILVDGFSIDGASISPPPSTVPGAPAGKIVALIDTGTPTAQIPQQLFDAIYGKIPGAILITADGTSIWTVPCNTTAILSIEIGGQPFPIHPLDLSDVYFDNVTKAVTCSPGPGWVTEAGDGNFDMIFGDAFMRNFYSVFNLGNSVANSPTANASIQLLSQTDPTTVANDVLKVRMAELAALPLATSSAVQSGSTPTGSVANHNGQSSLGIPHYIPVVSAIFLLSILLA
ncbi:aspartic peptidase domain-containing protein [Mycena maculata]|uniref:Aspartic peptidase domain-containing protein n=1 Tax=Mycena maculata TaxID=230809 RepID=A0AAD7NC06_9AGAR|nr:aspartic peptidase domain-containing protein [Mycena maculata]